LLELEKALGLYLKILNDSIVTIIVNKEYIFYLSRMRRIGGAFNIILI
jgi:hypothetical protein